ncbi:Hpt domain-containing protein [Arthrobacter globiformis]|uniref:Hpt domain-containing protein n=1 Tax=Arthrobacter globiformis TaxID=1665 RepID=UPI0027D78AFC|nr:Hpt domain-containing protein [Arthrobacter globiformis]
MDTTVFRMFEAQAGRNVAAKFFDDYLGLLPVRTASIVAGIETDDRERALDAAVSLKVVSAMVGARRMEGCAGALERQLRLGNAPAPTAAKRLLSRNILQILAESQRQGLLTRR